VTTRRRNGIAKKGVPEISKKKKAASRRTVELGSIRAERNFYRQPTSRSRRGRARNSYFARKEKIDLSNAFAKREQRKKTLWEGGVNLRRYKPREGKRQCRGRTRQARKDVFFCIGKKGKARSRETSIGHRWTDQLANGLRAQNHSSGKSGKKRRIGRGGGQTQDRRKDPSTDKKI